MRKAAFFAATLFATASLFAAPRSYNVTSDGKNYAMFTSEATLETIHGRTTNVTGTIAADPANVTGSTVDITIDLASLDTGIGMRNDHMKNKFLQVDKFPSATFKSVSVSGPKTIVANTPAEVQVTGDLTIHGVTKRITVPVHVIERVAGACVRSTGPIRSVPAAPVGVPPPTQANGPTHRIRSDRRRPIMATAPNRPPI